MVSYRYIPKEESNTELYVSLYIQMTGNKQWKELLKMLTDSVG